jgi:hypothetical protein
MNTWLFLASIAIAILGPIVAISYLRPILVKVLASLCDADGGAEFWIRCAYLLAICGTLLLMLTFGLFDSSTTLVDSLRRSLWLVMAGVFATVALISRNVWTQVRMWLARQDMASAMSSAPATMPRQKADVQ